MNIGEIKGWDFSRYYSADGSEVSTGEAIRSDKKKLEARLLVIPKSLASIALSIKNKQHEYDWLSGLSKSHQRSYERKHGKHPHAVASAHLKSINSLKATTASLKQEQARIPVIIKELQAQLETLVKGESAGLSKGLDKESAKALGEIELEKEKARLEHESKLQDIETQKAETIAQEEAQQREEEKVDEKGNNTKLIVGISITVVLIIIGIIMYRKRMVKGIVQPLKA
jgi:hypothetical protein